MDWAHVCGINRGHSAARPSLQCDEVLVTSICLAFLIPVTRRSWGRPFVVERIDVVRDLNGYRQPDLVASFFCGRQMARTDQRDVFAEREVQLVHCLNRCVWSIPTRSLLPAGQDFAARRHQRPQKMECTATRRRRADEVPRAGPPTAKVHSGRMDLL